MLSGQNSDGDSAQPLTVHSAAERIAAGLFSDEEETQPADSEPEEPEQETAEEPEATEDEENEADLESDDEPVETDEDAEDEPVQPRKFKVKVDDQEDEVTEDELLKGYSRTADYTRKTQRLAEERKAFEAEAQATRAARQQHHDRLTALENVLSSVVQEPDWDTLRREDPASFPDTFAAWQIHKQKLDGLRQEREQLEQKMRADADTQFKEYVKAEKAKLLEAIPDWKDSEKAKQDRAAIRDYANSIGFSDDDLSNVADHRALVVLRKAMLFDAAEKAKVEAAKKAEKRIEKVKAATPGPKSTRPPVTELTRRKQRLSKTHSIHDAASIVELMLPDE